MPTTVPYEAAQAEAAERAARTVAVLVPVWRASRRWTVAVVLALFPFLFIVDRAIETRLSPVLPGLVVLFLLVLVLPFAFTEVVARRYRRRELSWQTKRADRLVQTGRTAMIVAAIWLVLWFAVGT